MCQLLSLIAVKAGLFSAVLTAFLVESYKNLQVDRTDVAIHILQQIATQSYSINGGFFNATTPLSPLPDFVPPKWAVRVNVLWFSSLLCSLSVGSFGMLVKQWLQEYLSLDSMSAPLRVRTRIYRKRALRDWRVLEIAALLPFVLQVALVLFFLGMCYFTAVFQDSVSQSSVPLVAGWAFMISCSLLAPLIFPRCPFKTPWLGPLLRQLRKVVIPYIIHPIIGVFLATDLKHRSRRPRNEEEDLKALPAFDSLLLVDEAISDDGLIAALCEAFQASQPDPSDIVPFVARLIQHRLGVTSIEERHLSRVPDLQALALPVWLSVTDLIAAHLLQQLNDEPLSSRVTSRDKLDCILILLARSRFSLSKTGQDALHKAMTHRSWPAVCSEISDCHSASFSPMAKPILDSAKLVAPFRALTLYSRCLCPLRMDHKHQGDVGLLSILRDKVRHPASSWRKDILDDAYTVLRELMCTQLMNLNENDNNNLRAGSMEAMTIIWEFWQYSPKYRDAAIDVALAFWETADNNPILFWRCTALHDAFRLSTLPDILHAAFLNSSVEGEHTVY